MDFKDLKHRFQNSTDSLCKKEQQKVDSIETGHIVIADFLS